jgi:hypothetical protein
MAAPQQFTAPPPDGRLRLRGRLIEVELSFNGHRPHAPATSAYLNYRRGEHHLLSCTLLYDAPLVETEAVNPLSGEKVMTARRGREGDALDFFQGVAYCLDMGRWEPNAVPFALSGGEYYFFLVLVPSTTIPGAFERIGMPGDFLGPSESMRRDIWGPAAAKDIFLV